MRSLAIAIAAAVIAEGVVTGDGKPVAGARIIWRSEKASFQTRSSATGTFRIPDPRLWGRALGEPENDGSVYAGKRRVRAGGRSGGTDRNRD
ncbi:MAG TPA: hypothetical protein VJ032_09100 [Thermoanaerobaculia bacterium]|nr:hypothetical protein [Thermoanaerobaculia bacterium]